MSVNYKLAGILIFSAAFSTHSTQTHATAAAIICNSKNDVNMEVFGLYFVW